MRTHLLRKALQALRAGRLGDAGAYKAAALTGPACPAAHKAVIALAHPIPDMKRVSAGSFAPETLGAAYLDFIRTNGIKPIEVSADVREELQAVHPVAVRYLALHDLFHVVLGFGVDRPGELGVWTFVAEQRYSPTFARAAKAARWLYPLVEPSSARELALQRARGAALARRAPMLLGVELEAMLFLSLQEVRSGLGITGTSAA